MRWSTRAENFENDIVLQIFVQGTLWIQGVVPKCGRKYKIICWRSCSEQLLSSGFKIIFNFHLYSRLSCFILNIAPLIEVPTGCSKKTRNTHVSSIGCTHLGTCFKYNYYYFCPLSVQNWMYILQTSTGVLQKEKTCASAFFWNTLCILGHSSQKGSFLKISEIFINLQMEI